MNKTLAALPAKYLRAAWFAIIAAAVISVAPARTSAAAPPTRHLETATLAAGCFWSMEAMYKQLKGVQSVEPGYAGGLKPHPSYDDVETGNTGYAESVKVTYDPAVISYSNLVRVLLTSRDPTTLNRQGPDEGTQYRSVIFYRNPAQRQAALTTIRQVTAARLWPSPIVTAVMPFTTFYPAEGYHRNYYALHPDEPYCRFVIAPELAKFRRQFKDKLKN